MANTIKLKQLDQTELAAFVNDLIDGTGAVYTASRAVVTDSSGDITTSSVTATELGYLSGVTSAIQTQLNAKQATITGAATTITSSDLTASRALVSNGSGKVAVSSVTSTELGYVSGVTSAIQTQFSNLGSTYLSLAGGTLTGNTTIDGVQFRVKGTYYCALENTTGQFQGFDYVRLVGQNGYGAIVVNEANSAGVAFGFGGFYLGSSATVNWGAGAPGSSDVFLTRDAAATLAQRNGTNAQTFRVYGTYTDASNYVRASLAATSTTVTLAAETAGLGADDIDLTLTPAGAGLLKFGTHSAVGAESVTGFITIKDSGGTERKLAVIS